ncbi:MAG: EamA family transporter [Reichenbachiella sp.]
MKSNFWLFLIPALIWGSTWYVIKFQLGTVDPLISVVYRYYIAGGVMMLFCLIKGVNLKFSLKDHLFMAVQGFFLFGINYWMAYEAEVHITSGLMAVAFSTIVFMNSLFGRLFLKKEINRRVIIGALFGLSGTIFIFSNEFLSFNFSDSILLGVGIGMFSVVLASLGNITSARNSANGIPVIQANAFGMVYGALLMTGVALILQRPFTFEMSQGYVSSLLYLAVFGSVTAFGSYLTLISRIGPDKAAYALVVIPVISIGISMAFENYQLTVVSIIGIVLILIGNVLALRRT